MGESVGPPLWTTNCAFFKEKIALRLDLDLQAGKASAIGDGQPRSRSDSMQDRTQSQVACVP